MRVYLEAARLSYRRYRTYGAATLAGLATNCFFGVLRSAVFIAFYEGRPVAEGYSLHDALTYVWLTQGMIMPLFLWGWLEIAETIRTGAIASDLAKPVDYFSFWLGRDLGRAGYHLLYRWLPTILIGLIFFHTRLPGDALAWLAFAVSFLLAIILSFCLRFMINVVGFWTTDVRGIMGMVLLFVNFLTGFLVPLEFFPPALRAVVTELPFAAIISIPNKIFLEQAQGLDLLILLSASNSSGSSCSSRMAQLLLRVGDAQTRGAGWVICASTCLLAGARLRGQIAIPRLVRACRWASSFTSTFVELLALLILFRTFNEPRRLVGRRGCLPLWPLLGRVRHRRDSFGEGPGTGQHG